MHVDIIIDHEHGPLGLVDLGGYDYVSNPNARIIYDSRYLDRETRADPRLARHQDIASHQLTESTADHQTEARATILARRRCVDLRERLEQLEGDLALLQEFKGENERLRKLLDFSRGVELHGVVGSVIGFDPSGWVRGIVINKGSSSGIVPGLAVIHARGVVGQVVAVSPSTARILLLSDHSSGVDAVVQGSRARGIVEGSGGSMCELRYVNREYSIKPGELVLTSGMDGVFPKGLVVGSVTEVDAVSGGLFQSIALKPSVDFSRLEEVLILTSTVQDVSEKNIDLKDASAALPTERRAGDGAGVRRSRLRGDE